MANFRIDRNDLPKPWAKPLIFVLTGGDRSLAVEVEPKAAIEYQSALHGSGLAFALAPQRTEYFVQSVEDAANQIVSPGEPASSSRLLLKWSDLNPTEPSS